MRRGQATGTEIELERGDRVAGIVVDAHTGLGIVGASVTAVEPREFGTQRRLGYYQTDEDGAFELWLPVGKVAIYFGFLPSGYASPARVSAKTLEMWRASGMLPLVATLISR